MDRRHHDTSSLFPSLVHYKLKVAPILIEGMNCKFTPCPNLTLICLFRIFWVYINHQKRDHPILESSHMIEAFPLKNISIQTSIFVKLKNCLGLGFEWMNHKVLEIFN